MQQDLIDHLTATLPQLPDKAIDELVHDFGLTLKDAKTLVALDDGRRLGYFDEVLAVLARLLQENDSDPSITKSIKAKHAKLVANWCD